jgi:hypothetical protein
MKAKSAEHIAWIKEIIGALDPTEADEFCALQYWGAVWDDALEQEPPGTTRDELIAREKRHAEALRIKRHRHARTKPQ